jgi:hypothetical protein
MNEWGRLPLLLLVAPLAPLARHRGWARAEALLAGNLWEVEVVSTSHSRPSRASKAEEGMGFCATALLPGRRRRAVVGVCPPGPPLAAQVEDALSRARV